MAKKILDWERLRDGTTLRVSRTYRSRLDELLHKP
jgi:hypothetical protein